MSWPMLRKRSGAWTKATRRGRLRSLSSDEINLGHDDGPVDLQLVVLNVRSSGPRHASTYGIEGRVQHLVRQPCSNPASHHKGNLLQDDKHLTLDDIVRFFNPDFRHDSSSGRHHVNLHLHRLENEQRLILDYRIAWFGDDLPHVAHQLSLDFDQYRTPCKRRDWRRVREDLTARRPLSDGQPTSIYE